VKLLLHTCCGPCFLGTWQDLKDSDFEITNYYFNPNIYPESEHQKRLVALRLAAAGKTAGVIVIEYEPELHAEAIAGHEDDFPGRCTHCYKIRLEKTAEYAKEHGFDAFSTTLLVSPYQQHDVLRKLGEATAAKFGVRFHYVDWRSYYREGQNEARFIPIYRQKYCGCKYSLHPQK